jgi:hypothetical protein
VDLLTTYTHDSELQGIAALSIISTIHRSPQHQLSPSSLPALTNRFLVTNLNNGGSSASVVTPFPAG